MPVPYLHCPSCGQKALSVATRCPRCGLPFETGLFRKPASDSRPSRIPLGLLVAGVIVAVLVVNAVRRKLSVTPPVRPPATTVVSAPRSQPPPQPPRESLAVKIGGRPKAPPPMPRSPSQSQLPTPDSARSAPTAEPVGTAAAQRRYASTWMNVRADRSNTAPVIRILRPGEVVLVDLLEQGWYRVVTDRQAMGYVDRRYLDTSPPTGPP